MKYIFILFFFCFSIRASAQKTSYPAGAYFSLDDIQKKKPGKQPSFRMEKRDSLSIMSKGGNDFAAVPLKDELPQSTYDEYLLALSDGENLFLNGYKLNMQFGYIDVISEGKYFLFRGAVLKGKNTMTASAITGLVLAGVVGSPNIIASAGGSGLRAIRSGQSNNRGNMKRFVYVMLPSSGEIFVLNKKFVEYALENFPELWAKFENDDNNGSMEVMMKYIEQLNAATKNRAENK